MKRYSTTDGLTATEIDTNKTYPLTKEMPIGVEFEGEEVWQYQYRGDPDWLSIPPKSYPFGEYVGFMFNEHDAATRIAIEPIEKPLEGEEIIGSVVNIPNIEMQPSKGITILFEAVWNSAIDECVKAAESLPYKPFLLIDKLNSLRK